jgi:hypothetical protein
LSQILEAGLFQDLNCGRRTAKKHFGGSRNQLPWQRHILG